MFAEGETDLLERTSFVHFVACRSFSGVAGARNCIPTFTGDRMATKKVFFVYTERKEKNTRSLSIRVFIFSCSSRQHVNFYY